MVRETRHLWVGNLPDNIREDRIRDHFKRYGRVQSVKLLGGRGDKDEVCATVSFMDIKSAAKAHHSEQKLDERVLTTEYHEPAAIPTPRFHLGSEELSSSFDRSSHFYEGRGEGAGGYIRRSGYHSSGDSRTRPRERAYRNGPYTPIIESVVSRSGSSHGRTGSWSYESPSPRYPPSTPDISYQEPPLTILVHKKHSKSRSGSDSGSNSSRSRSSSASSQSGSSTCSTASSSPTSEKSCSTHSQQSTLRSSGAQSGSANHTSSSSPAVHSEDRRPLAICVRNLPARSSDTSLKDGLYHEYKKHGKVTWVKVVGQGVDRYALVSFKKPEDVDKALQVSHDKLFFGCKIEVAPYQGYDVEDNEFRPFEAEQDEFHPKATRTLFIGNLDKDITTQEIRKHFDQFGEIIDIDIKKQGSSSSYAFCQFSDIGSVVRAMRSLDGEHVGGNRVKLGFGKSMHTNCVWVDGVAETVSEKYLSQQFGQFGPVSHVLIDRPRGQALVTYEQIQYAQLAVKEMRGVVVRGRKLQVDYASRECQESFYDHMEKQSTPSTHPTFENSSSVGSSPQNLRVFESPSSSTAAPCVGSTSSVNSRYNSCTRYSGNRASSATGGFGRSTSPTSRSSRHSTSRFQEYPTTTSSGPEYERRSSYRSYEDVSQVEEGSTPTQGVGDIRHLQKERVSLLEQLEDCTSSGEEGTNRRRCNKHRRSQSGEGSRPGTPLCDERPENLGPVEPRRPRDSRPPDPLSLPLPRFASQVLSPRPAPPSPPASPQTHSSSSDSEPSPEWEERLRSLDEKYEKWSGSRAGLTKVDPSTLKVRHKLLELDLHELQPSDIVKSVLAKRSVFDEDSKRLENFGEKYEPREFIPARSSLLRGRLDLSPMSSPVVKSPSSPAAKGLQYPFPSHPPVQPTTSVATTTAPSALTVTMAATEVKSSPTTFLTNCTPTRQFPLPKISSPQAEKCEASPRIANSKVMPTPTTVAKPIMSCKASQEIKKDPVSNQTKVKNNTPLRRESSDDKKEESRRKSRDESVESVKSVESLKRDDTNECDKLKDSQVTERRKSVCEKRRSSSDIKDLCERAKDTEKRRGSSEIESDSNKKTENKKLFDENHMDIPKPHSEIDKSRKFPSDSVERKKESETNIRHSIDLDKKKDVLGVNSEKDRRRNRESSDSMDNPKFKSKVPDNKKELDSTDKRDKDDEVIKISDNDKKKESSETCSSQHLNRHKDRKDHQDRRRDSSEHSEKKVERISPENSEVHRIKEKKNHDLTEPRNSKKHHDEGDAKSESIKHHKDSERRKNSENEISKEHSLFKKVFGFAERTYGHHKDRRDSDSTAVKTDDTIKPHKRDHSEKERKREKDTEHSEPSKHRTRKSPDQPENNRHKERKHSESSEKRSRKEYDILDDNKQKDDHSDNFHTKSRDKKEERAKDSGKSVFSVDSEFLPTVDKRKDSERRKETSLEELRTSEADSNDLKLKDGDSKKENEVFFERRKEESSESRNKEERRKDSEKYFESEKYNNDRLKKDDSDCLKDLDKKDLTSDFIKFKHDRHRDNERKKEMIVENCRSKDLKDDNRQEIIKHKEDRKNDDIFDSLKSKDDNFRFRDYSRKKEVEGQDHIRIKDIIESKKKEEREKKKERESQELSFKKIRDSEEKNRDAEKTRRKKDYELSENKINGDHDDYNTDNIDCRKSNYEEEIRIDPIRKEKRKDRNSTWPATIGCKRRLSSQDCLDIVDDAKRSKPERRDSKDSGRSSGSSRKGSSEKHKGFTKLLEEKIKEDKENEQRKKEDLLLEHTDKNDEKVLKPAIRKEKRNSGEKRKEEKKLKSRPRENGTASESDIGSGDDETKSNKRQQHSIFDIVDDEPAYISMYDKVKARSTKNMQKQEEEKRQEKLKEKFHQLKASRAKREEKKRSTSYDEDSDSEKGGSRRSNKLLITSSEDDACSESDVRIRSRKILCDTSEDDTVTAPRSSVSKYFDFDSKSSRKIISDISEDDSIIKHSTPKLKSSRSITFDTDSKSRKIMSDTSEDDNTRHNAPRQKPSRIQSDDSEGDLSFVPLKTPCIEPSLKITDVFTSRPVEMNHFTSSDQEQKQHPLQSSPESIRRISLDSVSSEQHRKKSHKKKQKKKNYEVSEDGIIIPRKHSSKKEKKKSHRDNDDEDKKSRKKKTERESSSTKRDEKFEDIFGPLSDDSEKAALNKWQVSQVYGSDSESERENIRKKEKKRREKKLRELDEAGRALEAKLLDTSEDIIEEPVKTKKKKRKKSRDEKIKHHRILVEESTPPLAKDNVSQPEIKRTESEETKDSEHDAKLETDNDNNEREEAEEKTTMDINYDSHQLKDEPAPVARQHSSSLSSLLDSPPAQPIQHKKPDIPGFGSEVDENIHETAVKSISESTLEEQTGIPKEKFEEKSKPEEHAPTEDKPAPVISQEETEDAVAALLMEDTFGTGFETYSEDTTKPDTPVSEPDLQIDTDTEDNFDHSDFVKAPRDQEISSSFYQQNDTREGLEERIMPLACPNDSTILNKESEKSLESERTIAPKIEAPSSKNEVTEKGEELPHLSVDDKVSLEESPCESEKLEKKDIEAVVIKQESVDLKADEKISTIEEDKKDKNEITDLTIDEESNPQPCTKIKAESVTEIKEEPKEAIIVKEEKNEDVELKEVKLEVPQLKDVTNSQAESKEATVIKPLQQEKLPEPLAATNNPVIQHLQKTEKVVHHQAIPVSHSPLVVHQAVQQPQNAQVAKPLTIQVINPPALKPLEQIKKNTEPQANLKLSSPPLGLTSNTNQALSFPQKSQQSTNQSPLQKPVHHLQAFPGIKLPSPIPHLVPPHIPVKPASQLTLQAPQLTPISKGNLAPPPRPVIVHTIQNHSSQKQLHVVTPSSQLSPQPLSPQNLKVIRPVHNSGISVRSPSSPQTLGIRPPLPPTTVIPLLQTVSGSDAPLNKQFAVRPPLQVPNTHCTNQVTHLEKIVNLSPNQPLQNVQVPLTQKPPTVNIIKPAEAIKSPGIEENDFHAKTSAAGIEKKTGIQLLKPLDLPQPGAISLPKPPITINSAEESSLGVDIAPIKKESDDVLPIRHPVFEPKLIKPNFDEPKPLNAVIQDLTLRAANKALGKPSNTSNISEIKSESSKPIEQVVREIQLRKKAAILPPEPEKPVSPPPEKKPKEEEVMKMKEEERSVIDEPSVKEISENKVENLKETANEQAKTLPLLEAKAPGEQLKVDSKNEGKVVIKGLDEKPTVKEAEAKTEKVDIETTPPPNTNKNETKVTPETPELRTPKSHSEPEFPSSEERITSEKATPVHSSGRGRGGRTRGKRGRGAGVATRRGGRQTTSTISHTTPSRPQAPADVYEFRDDSEEERPRLILTIKPDPPPQHSSHQVPSTRKSRRLQEKDGSRSNVEDTIEDVIRCTGRPGRRATRSTAPLLSLPTVETTRKSPRRKQVIAAAAHDRSPTPQLSPTAQPAPATDTSPLSTPSPAVLSPVTQPAKVMTPQQPISQTPQQSQPHNPQPAVHLSAQREQPLQPLTKETSSSSEKEKRQTEKEPSKIQQEHPSKQQKEEVKHPPQQKEPLSLQTAQQRDQIHPISLQPVQKVPQKQPILKQSSPVAPGLQQPTSHPMPVKLPPKLQSSLFAKGDFKPLMPQRPGIPGEPTTLIDPVTGLLIPMREGEEGQYIPVGGDGGDAPPEKRPRLDDSLVKAPIATVRPSVVRPPQQPPHSLPKPASPPNLPQKPVVNSTVPRPPKAHLLQAVAAERAKIIPPPRPKLIPPQTQPIQAPKPPTPLTPKAHILQAIGNAQAREGIVGSPAPHQGSILTGSVASPPLRAHPQPIVTGASSARYVMKGHTDPGGRVGPEGGCIVVPSPSPQPPPRGQVLQAGLPVPAYEASLGEVVQHVNYPAHHIQPAHYVHPQLMYQQYLREATLGPSPYHRGPGGVKEVDEAVVRSSPPLELRRRASPHDRTTDSPQVATLYGRHLYPPPAHRPAPSNRHQVATPPHASQVPPQADSLLVLLQRYPVMWQGLLALKNDQAAVQMHFVFGNPHVARDSLPCNSDGSTPPLRISQRMRLEQTQLDGVARKMQMDNEHCMLLALPCGRDHMDVLQQSNNLQSGFITYLQQKQAAGIVNIAAPGSQQAAYVVHIFPASEFANDSLARIAPDLLHRVTDIAHLLIVIATV